MSSSITNQAILLSANSGLSDRIPESQITAVFYPEHDNWICISLFPVQVQHSILIQVNTYAETLRFPQLVLQGRKKKKKTKNWSAQTVKHLPAMQETWVQSLGWEDPLEKEMATHSSTLAWKIPWTDKPDRLQFKG